MGEEKRRQREVETGDGVYYPTRHFTVPVKYFHN